MTVELVPGDSSGHSEGNDLYCLLSSAQESVALEIYSGTPSIQTQTQPVQFLQWRLTLGFLGLKNLRLGPIYRPEQTPRRQRVSVGVRGMHVVRATSHDHDTRCARPLSTTGRPPSLTPPRRTLPSRPSPTHSRRAPNPLAEDTRIAQASSADTTSALCPEKPVVPRSTHCSWPLTSRLSLDHISVRK